VTLRSRVVLIVTSLVVIGIALASLVAYGSARSELHKETDRLLTLRSNEVLGGTRNPPRQGERNNRDNGEPLSFDPDAITQTLDAGGNVTASGGGELPVTAVDVAIAAGGRALFRDIEIDGVEYRLLTVHNRADGGAVQVARDVSSTTKVLSGLRWRLVALGAALAALAAGAGWLLMRRTTQPLEDLTAATERVAATRDLTPLRLERDDEVGRLADSFDQMLVALSVSREQQRRLVQDAGHELRTPLTSLRANIEFLQRAHDLPADERDTLLAGVRSEIEELGDLFDEVMLLATDDVTRAEPDTELDLAEVVSDAVERFRRRTERTVEMSVEPTLMMGNPTLLERAVTNLLGNAHKFSPPSEPIDVALANHTVTVRDHGPGIAPADVDRVFDRFYRADDARSQPGSGLGLAIVRQIAEQHGATVSATNAPDGGAIVRIVW
jgi:two-component system sensor histidine kinase MprB